MEAHENKFGHVKFQVTLTQLKCPHRGVIYTAVSIRVEPREEFWARDNRL